ncbi:MAG: phosphate signaling complex protein PhoU [Gemmatales bacterium]|nr:phosphate signaling complex protein PhoU [Gemmatales bacterium]MDW8174463.1 phosphate signaling complex protein PhoU [Gemmatales bacterium]
MSAGTFAGAPSQIRAHKMIHFHRDLINLEKRVWKLAGRVLQTVDQAIRALCDRQMELALELLRPEVDTQIDMEEVEVENECLKILALHQPVAADLRRVAGILKINTDLERVGDLAINIAERAVAFLQGRVILSIPSQLRQMTDLAKEMVHLSLDAFRRSDARLAREICLMDETVDRVNRQIIEHLIEVMKQAPENIEPGLNLFSTSRHLERIADHATNIAEDVVYMVEGQIIRHDPEALIGRASHS